MLDQFRDLFGRFENLNLINLLIDLEKDEVPMGSWVVPSSQAGSSFMCPMAHGVDCSTMKKRTNLDNVGWSLFEVLRFANWWDGVLPEETCDERQDQLTQMINSMWQERMEDADAVQEVLEQEPLIEEQPCLSNAQMVSAIQL